MKNEKRKNIKEEKKRFENLTSKEERKKKKLNEIRIYMIST